MFSYNLSIYGTQSGRPGLSKPNPFPTGWQAGSFDWFPEASRNLGSGLLWTGPSENDYPAGLFFPCGGTSLTHVARTMLDPLDNGRRDRST